MWRLQFLKTNPQSVSNMHTETIRSKTESNSRHMDYKHIYICQSIHCFTGEGNRQYQEIPLLSHTSKYGHIKSFGQAASTYYGYSYDNIYNYIWFDYNIYIYIWILDATLFWQYADLFIDVSCFNIVTSAAGTIFLCAGGEACALKTEVRGYGEKLVPWCHRISLPWSKYQVFPGKL